jgi:TetR/AcrR family transcriptional regulator, transcriptional repressor for nem operon
MGRPRTFDESQVLRQAREAFHDHGYAGTSVEELTAATGLQRSSLYGAFGDKHGLFLRSFAQYCDEDMGLIEEELAGEDDGALARIEGHLRSKTADPVASRRGCLLAKAAAELAKEDPDVARMATDSYGVYTRALTDCLRGAQAAGDVRDDIDPDEAGDLLLAVLRGIESLGRAGYPKSRLDAIADAALTSLAAPAEG